jgi:hypothetical protein
VAISRNRSCSFSERRFSICDGRSVTRSKLRARISGAVLAGRFFADIISSRINTRITASASKNIFHGVTSITVHDDLLLYRAEVRVAVAEQKRLPGICFIGRSRSRTEPTASAEA